DRVDVGDLLEERQVDEVVRGDAGCEPQRDADVAPLDGGEQVRQVGRAGRPAGDEGHVATDDDLRLLVVGRDHVGGRQHVDVALRLERGEQQGVGRYLLAVGRRTVWLLAAAKMRPGSDVGLLTAVPSAERFTWPNPTLVPPRLPAPCSSIPSERSLSVVA